MTIKNKMQTGKTESRHLASSTERPESGRRITLLEKIAEQMINRLRKVSEYSALRNGDGSTLKIQVSYGPGQRVSNRKIGRAGNRVSTFLGKHTDSAGIPQFSLEIPEGYIGDEDATIGQLALGVAVVGVRSLNKFSAPQEARVKSNTGLPIDNYPVTQKKGYSHALACLGYEVDVNWVLSGKGGAMSVKPTSPESVSYLDIKRESLTNALRGTCDTPIFFDIKKSEKKDDTDESTENEGHTTTLNHGTSEARREAWGIFGCSNAAEFERAIMGLIQARIDTAKDEARTLRAVNS